MPTEKPRITFALDEDVLEQLNDYKFQHRYKNQSQAILALIDLGLKKINAPTEEQMNELSARAAALPATLSEGLDDLSKRVSHSDASSIEAADFAARFQRLDAHGKRVVEAVLELELERCAESTPSEGSARTE